MSFDTIQVTRVTAPGIGLRNAESKSPDTPRIFIPRRKAAKRSDRLGCLASTGSHSSRVGRIVFLSTQLAVFLPPNPPPPLDHASEELVPGM